MTQAEDDQGRQPPEARVQGETGTSLAMDNAATVATGEPTDSSAGPSSLAPPLPPLGNPTGSPSVSDIKIYGPAGQTESVTTPSDDAFFEPTLNDVQALHRTVQARSARLNEAPLLTAKHREAERIAQERKKADKWPNTTIRVKFSDGTVVQNVFPSNSPIQPVYAFVRTTLDPSVADRPFLLWQPPRVQYPEHPPPPDPKKPKAKIQPSKTSIIPPANYGHIKGSPTTGLQSGTGGRETLTELGLVPQSVLLIKWTGEGDEGMNASGFPAPLLSNLKARLEPLPPSQPKEVGSIPATSNTQASGEKEKGEKKIPKWLQKGLLKKK